MPIKTLVFFLLSGTVFAAGEPIAPYLGTWAGVGNTRAGAYDVSVTMQKTGPFIAGTYKAVSKGGGAPASGSYRGKLRPDGCYDITVWPEAASVRELRLAACLDQKKVITIESLFMSGTGTPSDGFTKCAVEASGPLADFSGILYKQKADKKKASKKKSAPPPINLEIQKN